MIDYDLDKVYTYHETKPQDLEKYPAIRSAARNLAEMVLATCPESRERDVALQRIEEAVMWANAAIARD